MNGLTHQLGSCRGLLQLQISRAGDVDQCTMCTLDALFEQWGADGDLGGLSGAILAPRGTDTEQRGAGTTEDGVHVGEIHVNVGIHRDEVGDALHTGKQRGIGGFERLDDTDGAIGELKQAIVRNNNQRVNFLT